MPLSAPLTSRWSKGMPSTSLAVFAKPTDVEPAKWKYVSPSMTRISAISRNASKTPCSLTTTARCRTVITSTIMVTRQCCGPLPLWKCCGEPSIYRWITTDSVYWPGTLPADTTAGDKPVSHIPSCQRRAFRQNKQITILSDCARESVEPACTCHASRALQIQLTVRFSAAQEALYHSITHAWSATEHGISS